MDKIQLDVARSCQRCGLRLEDGRGRWWMLWPLDDSGSLFNSIYLRFCEHCSNFHPDEYEERYGKIR